MASPTNIQVTVDNTEYSRYEEPSNTITVTVVVTGGAPYSNEQIRIDLMKARRARNVITDSKTITINGSSPQTFTTTFYLPDIMDQDAISLIRFGKYFIRATSVSDTDVYGDSNDFDIRVITISKFKEDYLFGIRLTSTEIKYIKYQPVQIFGVTVTEVSRNSQMGFGNLVYTYTTVPSVNRTLSWNGGTAVQVNTAGIYVLRGGGVGPLAALGISYDYIVIKIDNISNLPITSVTEGLIVEEKTLTDSTIASYLDKAVSYVENVLLQIRIEPTVVTTDIDPTQLQYSATSPLSTPLYIDNDWDFLVSRLTYFAPIKNNWLSFNTPYYQLLRVDSLYGQIAGSRVIDFDLNQIQITQNGGMVQLVPVNSQVYNYLGLLWSTSLRGVAELPNFLGFYMVVGLREATADIRDYIAKKAAIDLLGILGAAYRPGLGSSSISRDGVSQSVAYTAQQKLGIYTGILTLYTDQLKELTPKLQAVYRGSKMVVV